jgi:hypothetical protein
MDMQTTSRDLICTIHGDAKFRNLSWNATGAGVSMMKFGTKYFTGAKLENVVTIRKQVQLAANAGRMASCGQVAHGGGMEITVRGKDYPVREESATIAVTSLSFEKETVMGGNLKSDFRVDRG